MLPSRNPRSPLAICLAGAALASAQGVTQSGEAMSTVCQAASGTLVTSEFGKCANLTAFVPVLAAKNSSVLAPLAGWQEGVCSSSPCPDSVASSAAKSVTDGCKDDVQKGNAAAVSLTSVVSNYKMVRDVICLKTTASTDSATRCLQIFLADFEKATNKSLTLLQVENFIAQGFSALGPALHSMPKEKLCTDCTHGLATLLSTTSSSNMGNMSMNMTGASMDAKNQTMQKSMNGTGSSTDSAAQEVSSICGASFLDGKVPSSLSSGSQGSSGDKATTSSPASGNAANSAGNSIHSQLRFVLGFFMGVATLALL